MLVVALAVTIGLTAGVWNTVGAGSAQAAPISNGSVGTNAVTTLNSGTRVQDFDAMKSAGIGSVRLLVEWPRIEPYQNNFTWTETDAMVLNAYNRGMTILGVLTYAPSWATGGNSAFYIHASPASADTWAEFVRRAADRYRGLIRNWEIWNEPNIQASFAPAPNPVLYSSMLSKSYTAIKGVDPYAVVITGGTSPAADTSTTMSPAAFVASLYANGAGNSFDGVGMHPYSVPDNLSTNTTRMASKTAISSVTNVLVNNQQSYKRLWFTEFGASTCSAQAVSETRQSQILVDGIQYMRSLPNGGPIFIFDFRDIQTGSSNIEYCYGMVRTDFTAKASLQAVKPYL